MYLMPIAEKRLLKNIETALRPGLGYEYKRVKSYFEIMMELTLARLKQGIFNSKLPNSTSGQINP